MNMKAAVALSSEAFTTKFAFMNDDGDEVDFALRHREEYIIDPLVLKP